MRQLVGRFTGELFIALVIVFAMAVVAVAIWQLG